MHYACAYPILELSTNFMIRLLLSVTITFLCIIPALSQSRVPIEEYGKRDWPGGYIDLDGEFHEGWVYIFPLVKEKLRFRENNETAYVKLKSHEIQGFVIGNDEFHSLESIPFVGAWGIKGELSSGFGRLVTLGKIEAFQVYKYEYNSITGYDEFCENLVLFKDDSKMAVPVNFFRLKRGHAERIKDDLKLFFDHDPYWNQRIDLLINKESGFVGIYDLVEEYNQGA